MQRTKEYIERLEAIVNHIETKGLVSTSEIFKVFRIKSHALDRAFGYEARVYQPKEGWYSPVPPGEKVYDPWLLYYKTPALTHTVGDPLLKGHDTNGIGGTWIQATRLIQ